jgi:5'(3')-deoxyribonucleotidase
MNQREVVIGIDVDGTVADLQTEWLNRYNKEFDDNVKLSQWKTWDLTTLVKPETVDRMFEYLSDPDLYDHVEPIKGSLDAVNKLRTMGFEIIFITSCVKGSMEQKLDWLIRHGFLEDPGTGQLSQYIPCNKKDRIIVDVLIDDGAHNVTTAYGKGLLFTRPWNEAVAWPYRADSWEEVPDKIVSMLAVFAP